MNTRAFKLLIWNTIQKEVRSKSFFMAVILTIAMLGISYAIMQAFREEIQVEGNIELFGVGQLLWVYYAFINAWSIFLGLMFGLGCVRSDINSQVIGQLLALPIKRSEYLGARVLGSWFLVIFYQLLSFAMTGILFGSNLSEIPAGALAIAPLISIFPTLAAVIVGLLVSDWVGKTSGMILTGLASLGAGWARTYFSQNQEPFANLGFLKIIGIVLWIVVPRYAAPHSIVQKIAGVPGIEIAWGDISQFIVASVCLFLFNVYLFTRRGF